jgi:3-oxoacyl-[acyl-carrier protein] reductase
MKKSNMTEMKMTAENQFEQSKLLHDKVAVIFGAGGAIGSQVAREFSKEGATVFLSGRHLSSVESVAKEIRTSSQGNAQAAEVDALNEKTVTSYLDNVVRQAEKVDIVFNAIGLEPVEFDHGKPATELSYEKFMVPLTTYVGSNFLTARAAARHMLTRHSGVIIFLTATPGKGVAPHIPGIGTTFGAIEALARCLAAESFGSQSSMYSLRWYVRYQNDSTNIRKHGTNSWAIKGCI